MREAPAIDGYGGGGFRIGGERIQGSVLILDDVVCPWPVGGVHELTPAAFDQVLAVGHQAVEFVLLGTGKETAPPPKAVRAALREAGLGLELMNTIEAVKLYNVLAQDGRRIAAALIAV